MKIHDDTKQATETPAPPPPVTQEQQALNNLIQMAHAFVDSQAAIILMAITK
jgi:hypothetical protein